MQPLDYYAFGLRIRSELELPELAPWTFADESAPEVSVRLGLAGEIEAAAGRAGRFRISGSNDCLFEVRGVARFRVRGGNEITIEPAVAATPASIREYLLGSTFGALLHQRGLLVLHASAIEVGGRCVAFAGPSGQGKSTTAAFFYAKGSPLLCDDICVVSYDDNARPIAWPGLSRLKLSRDAASRLSIEVDEDGWLPSEPGYHVMRVRRPSRTRAIPFGCLYVLDKSESVASAEIRSLSGAAAVTAILSNTYRPRLLAPMGLAQSNLAQCVSLADAGVVYRATRRFGFDALPAIAQIFERHIKSQAIGR